MVCVCTSDHQMMTRPLSAVGYRRPLSQHARMAIMMKPDMRYKVSSTFQSLFSLVNIVTVQIRITQSVHINDHQ